MDTNISKTVEIDMKSLLSMLIHKLWIIVLISIIGALGAFFVSNYLMQPVYTSTSKVYVINRQDDKEMTVSDMQTGTWLTQDYMILVTSRPVMEQVIANLGLSMTTEELAGRISVAIPEGTRILEISVNHNDPEMAKKIVDAVAEISSVQMVNVMEMDKVNIVEKGNLPTSPSSPDIMINSFLGGLLGFVLVSFLFVILFLVNDSIKTSEDIEKYLGITTLGMIPLEEDENKLKHKTKIFKNRTALTN